MRSKPEFFSFFKQSDSYAQQAGATRDYWFLVFLFWLSPTAKPAIITTTMIAATITKRELLLVFEVEGVEEAESVPGGVGEGDGEGEGVGS